VEMVKKIGRLMEGCSFDYAICGGYAIDLFVGYKTREHGDIDLMLFWDQKQVAADYLHAKGYEIYEMLGGGKVRHMVHELSDERRNVFGMKPGCPLVELFETGEENVYWMRFHHDGQNDPDYIEFLFNDIHEGMFIYPRAEGISREKNKAILERDRVRYLAPEICLLYKSSELDRNGYIADFEVALPLLDAEQKIWLAVALRTAFPDGHEWIERLEKK